MIEFAEEMGIGLSFWPLTDDHPRSAIERALDVFRNQLQHVVEVAT